MSEIVHEIKDGLIYGQLQPLKLIIFPYLPSLINIHLVSTESALMIMSYPILFLLAVSNYWYIVIIEWSKQGNRSKTQTLLVALLKLIGVLSLEIIALYAGAMTSIFHDAEKENAVSHEISEEVHEKATTAKIQLIALDIVLETYFSIQFIIEKRITRSIISKVLESL